jgi:cell division protein FtsZ
VLQGAVQGIAELITRPGLINVDFADVRTVMSETGMAMMGSGSATRRGPRARRPRRRFPRRCSRTWTWQGAQGILVNVTAGMDLSIGEFQEVGSIVKQFASDDATVVVGTVIDPEMQDELRVTVVATGLGRPVPPSRGRDADREPARRRPCASRTWRATWAASRRCVRATLQPVATDYAGLDKPAVQRKRARWATAAAASRWRGSARYPGLPASTGRLTLRGRRLPQAAGASQSVAVR